MTDTDKTLAPALTAEEWARRGCTRGATYARINKYGRIHLTDDDDRLGQAEADAGSEHALMALCNAALPEGHPGKLGWADVEWLKGIATYLDGTDNAAYERHSADVLAAKLAALLPQRS